MKRRISLYFSLIILIFLFSCKLPIENSIHNNTIIVNPVTFGTNGIVITDVGNSGYYGRSLAIDSNGKIVVAGYTYNGMNYDILVVRYNSDGSLNK